MELIKDALRRFRENNSEDLTVFSEVPDRCKLESCYFGIDEAGRGPVLGPMVYGIFGCVADKDAIEARKKKGHKIEEIERNPPVLIDTVPKLNDSKQLTEKLRDEILERLVKLDYVVFGLKIISPVQISAKSFRRQKYSLNEISHNAAIELIKGFVDRGVKIDKIFVDTVGPMDKYQQKLQLIFPDLTFKVDQKADAKYKPVSAASICAKVTRDEAIKGWNFNGQPLKLKECGSGYPGDPKTKKFLRANMDPIFGFPNIVRNSWATASDLLEKTATKVKWEVYEEKDKGKDDASLPKISKFLKRKDKPGATDASQVSAASAPYVRRKAQFFSYRNLEQTVTL